MQTAARAIVGHAPTRDLGDESRDFDGRARDRFNLERRAGLRGPATRGRCSEVGDTVGPVAQWALVALIAMLVIGLALRGRSRGRRRADRA